MTEARRLGRFAIWRSASLVTPELAAGIERLGFGALWLGSSPAGDLAQAEELLDATTTLILAGRTECTSVVTSSAAACGCGCSERSESGNPTKNQAYGAARPESRALPWINSHRQSDHSSGVDG